MQLYRKLPGRGIPLHVSVPKLSGHAMQPEMIDGLIKETGYVSVPKLSGHAMQLSILDAGYVDPPWDRGFSPQTIGSRDATRNKWKG